MVDKPTDDEKSMASAYECRIYLEELMDTRGMSNEEVEWAVYGD